MKGLKMTTTKGNLENREIMKSNKETKGTINHKRRMARIQKLKSKTTNPTP